MIKIQYFFAPVCPKCFRINQWLKALQKEKPEITIEETNILFNWKKARKNNIRTIPTILIGENRLEGFIKKEEFNNAIETFNKK
ncbi:MAG: thioredoxin family protein [Asgard group archaeon]|nr:thioredoxin family protein [Asgard group archaeon]